MSSPWGKVDQPEPVEFHNIMSEQLAHGLQDKENRKIEQRMKKQYSDLSEKNVKTNSSTMNYVPHDVNCDSDRAIAEILQIQFDQESDAELKRYEKQQNKESKVSVSFSNYLSVPDGIIYDSDTADRRPVNSKHWDRFETNEKRFENLSKKGLGFDEDGVMVTKHDAKLCGVRNACRVMSFPPEFNTGDAAGFDMKLSNPVFNDLKRHSQKPKKHKAQDRREHMATAELSIDKKTRLILYKMINNEVFQEVNGIISTGKEAVIVHAFSDANYEGELNLPKECAIKIFKTTLNEFKQRDRYIKDDYRFKDRFSKQNNRTVINMWAEKEMHNLMRMKKYDINCPDVVLLKKNILVMSFIGEDNVPAAKLKDVKLNDAELSLAYEEIVNMMKKLYNEANLVHADLSEYNILWYDDKPWFIDVAQSVEPGHPSALEFMMRDCNNISTFFRRRGLSNVKTGEELFSFLTELDSSAHNAAMLERIRDKGPSVVMATAPQNEDIPDHLKPLSYPFDYAWEKTQKERATASNEPEESVKCCKIPVN